MDAQTPPYLRTDDEIEAAPRRRLTARRGFLSFVILPTVLAALWLFLFAADQYASEAHFMVRSADRQAVPTGGALAQLVGIGGAAGGTEAVGVADYLTSHDAIAAADERLDLTAMFRRDEADLIARLWSADPAAETLAKYVRGQVSVEHDIDSGLVELHVRTFRPADSEALAETLLMLGEERVNALNRRGDEALLESARRQVDEAETELRRIGGEIAAYRRQEGQLDPKMSGKAETELTTSLRGALADLRAQEGAMAGSVAADSPQLVALRRRIAALAAEVAAADARISGTGRSLTAGVGRFETLRIEQEFAAKRYEVAAAAFESAREQAARQRLFLVRIVEPNLPERALYPRRFTIVVTLFAGLALLYGIGWLILAGIREHAD
ncbi:MAG: hypothetical protein AAF205_04965 [Pseudomonadota bacterium]